MMAITWYLVGILAAGSVYVLVKLSQKYRPQWFLITALAIGIGMILFCMTWSMGSILEGVPRAAAMGIVCFGFPGIVLTTIASRLIAIKAKNTR